VSEQIGVPAGVDPTVPSVARVYDQLLFGKYNYESDRRMTQEVVKATPDAVWAARQNRAFLQRAIRYLTEVCGIRQFIDHGSGLPTQDNVHEVAQRHQPGSRVVYTDNDPTVLAYGRALLAEDSSTIVIQADMAEPDGVLNHPDVRKLIDFDQPVGLLYFSVLHCLKDSEDPGGVVKHMLDAVPSGSHVALSHACSDDEQAARELTDALNAATRWGRVRFRDEIARFFDGLEVVEPGLGDVAEWRLDLGPAVFPRPELAEGDEDPWGPEWRDDFVDTLQARKLWEEGGVARKP
jgi:hypothetical protein